MDLVKVEGYQGLSRDLTTGAIVNTNRQALLAARRRKQEFLEKDQRLKELEAKVERLTEALEKILEEKE